MKETVTRDLMGGYTTVREFDDSETRMKLDNELAVLARTCVTIVIVAALAAATILGGIWIAR